MEKGKMNRKSLLVGVIAAVVVLAALLALLLTQCAPWQSGDAAASTAAPTEGTPTYELYWNLDREEYDGKSEAGLSSRTMESDGLFHIRFFLNGEVVELLTPDRRLVNKIDVMDLMGLKFDAEGYIVDVIDIDDLPLELVAFKFYVQSVGGNMIKLNSSQRMEGMQVLLEKDGETGIYDMSGVSGPKGNTTELTVYDRVICIQDLAGRLSHVFVFDRSNFMLTHEGECQHCKETVTWYEWTKKEELPDKSGHYQLMNDVQLKTQLSMPADMKFCLDLNGYTISGTNNTRLISLHNVGAELALMDTSEAKTGKLVGHSTASPQGGVVWVRYGAFYMYAGTLDGSDMISRLNGTVVEVTKNGFFYLYDGTIIGGTSQAQPKADTASGYAYGLAGSVSVTGTMRMYGGTIRDGKAIPAYYYDAKGKLAISRGLAGNIFLANGSVFEMVDGQILNGYAGNCGGNIYADGTAELNISGGLISGGWNNSQVANHHGGNIYLGGKSVMNMTGGSIQGGSAATAAGGNIYVGGTLNLYGGVIGYGKAFTSGGNIHMGGSSKFNMFGGLIVGGYAKTNAGNINVSGSSTMNLYAGTISGGEAGGSGGNIACNTKGVLNMYGGTIADGISKGQSAGHGGGNLAIVADGASANISGGILQNGKAEGTVNEDGTTLGGDGANININRGTVNLTGGVITGGKGTGYCGGIYVGWNSVGLTLGGDAKIYGNGSVDILRSANTSAEKSQIIIDGWKGNGTAGTLYIGRHSAVAGTVVASPVPEATLSEELLTLVSSNHKVLPLDIDEKGQLILAKQAYLGEPDHTHCLCGGKLAGHECAETGFVSVDAETFAACFGVSGSTRQLLGSQNICLTEDVVLDAEHANMGSELNICLHGHTITMQNKARFTSNKDGLLNITDCTGKGKIVAAEGCRYSFFYTYKGRINLYAGTIDGSAIREDITNTNRDGAVMNIYYPEDTFAMYGGTIIGGQIYRGGAVYAYKGTFEMYGGTITGGSAAIGGNVATNYGPFHMYGGTITGGNATTNGAGVFAGHNSNSAVLISGNAKIYGNTGREDVYLGQNPANGINYLVLDSWQGNGEEAPMTLLCRDAALGAVIAQAQEGQLVEADRTKLTYYADGTMVKLSEGKLLVKSDFEHYHCACDGTADHSHSELEFDKVENAQQFAAFFNSKKELKASVSLALVADITLDAEYKLAGHTLDLCLNGNTITMEGKGRITANGGTGVLNITDCGEAGAIVAEEGCRNSFIYGYNGSVNIFAGTVDASKVSTATGYGAAILVERNDFTMYGGTIIGGTAERGGSIYMQEGTFTMYGGTIRDGSANLGGNVHMNFGSFAVYGGTVTGGHANTGAGVNIGYNITAPVILSGDAKIYGNTGSADLGLNQNPAKKLNYMTLDGWNGNGEGLPVMTVITGDAVEKSVVAQAKEGSLAEADLLKFTVLQTDLIPVLDAGKIILKAPHQHCLCNGTLDHTHEVLSFEKVETTAQFKALFNSERQLIASTNVMLAGDITLDAEYAVAGNTLNLCLNGYTITMQGNGRLTSNGGTGLLNITDCGEDGAIVAAEGCRISFIYGYNGVINLYGGTVDAFKVSTATGYGAAVLVNKNAFTMYGGTIIGGTAERGGSIYMQEGTFTMYGGTIRDGSANLGGNIHLNFGSFAMYGGTITGGHANTGAGVNIGYNITAPVILSGDAKIYGNTGSADLGLNQNANNKLNFVTLDGWNGNGEGKAAMTVLTADEAENSVIAQAKEGQLTEADVAKLVYATDAYKLVLADGKLQLRLVHAHCLCNGELTHECQRIVFDEVATAEQFDALFNASHKLKADTNIVLTGSFTLEDTEYVTDGKTLNLCLNGHTITMKGTARLTANGTIGVLNITDCGDGSIKADEQSFRYGFIYAYNGQINLYGGTLDASAVLYDLADQTKQGGAVYVDKANDVFTMYGGTIVGGELYRGGAVYVNYGEFVMHGGEIYGGTADVGGNVATNYGHFKTMTGGKVYGGTDAGTGVNQGANVMLGYQSTSTLTLSGDAMIYGGIGTEDVRLGQKSASNRHLVLDSWQGNGENPAMRVSLSGAAQNVTVAVAKEGRLTEADIGKLLVTETDLELGLEDGKLVLVNYHRHCICAGTLAGKDGHTCEPVIFTEVTAQQFLSDVYWTKGSNGEYTLKNSVNLCLTEPVTLAEVRWTGANTLNLCLCGQTVSVTTGRIGVENANGALNIVDCATGGTIQAAAKDSNFAMVYPKTGPVTLYSGIIDASLLEANSKGGAVYVNTATGSFTMYGGQIKGAASANHGAAVYIDKGSFVMHGGTITGGNANIGECKGGAVMIGNVGGSFTMYGGTVTGGTASLGGNIFANRGTVKLLGGTVTGGTADRGAGIYMAYNANELVLSGDAKVYGNGTEDISRSNNPSTTVNHIVLDGWNGNGANGKLRLGRVDAADEQVIVTGKDLTDSVLQLLESSDANFELKLVDGKVVLEQLHRHCICAGTLNGKDGHTCEPVIFTEVTAQQFLSDTYWEEVMDGEKKEYKLKADATLCLTEDVTLATEYSLGGKTLDLCLNGKTVTMSGSNARLTTNGSGKLNLTDCGTTGKFLAESKDTQTAGLYTQAGVTTMYAGTIDAGLVESTGNGGAVYVNTADASFVMYGGTITGAKKAGAGGTVYVNAGSFTMHDGTINGGTATNGGSIFINTGTVRIKGGTVSGGTATGTSSGCGGGNIHLNNASGKLYVEGGTITGGNSTSTHASNGGNGGNININKGSVYLSGGVITAGSADKNGAGVYLGYTATNVLELSGNALIHSNNGHDVFLGSNTTNYVTLNNWAGNGTYGALKLDKLSAKANSVAAVGKDSAALTAEDLALFTSVNANLKLSVSSGKLVFVAK